jgi:hypothetical protein
MVYTRLLSLPVFEPRGHADRKSRRLRTRVTIGFMTSPIPKCMALVLLAMALVISGKAAARERVISLSLEQHTTLRVGEMALLSIPSDRRYDHYADPKARIDGVWKDVLDVVRHSKRKVIFRATHPGSGVLLLSPDVPNGECISCATLRYFITVY